MGYEAPNKFEVQQQKGGTGFGVLIGVLGMVALIWAFDGLTMGGYSISASEQGIAYVVNNKSGRVTKCTVSGCSEIGRAR